MSVAAHCPGQPTTTIRPSLVGCCTLKYGKSLSHGRPPADDNRFSRPRPQNRLERLIVAGRARAALLMMQAELEQIGTRPGHPLARRVSRAWMSARIGVSLSLVFLKYSVHSTVGKSRYSTPTQRNTNPVFGSVYVSVCSMRLSSSCRLSALERPIASAIRPTACRHR